MSERDLDAEALEVARSLGIPDGTEAPAVRRRFPQVPGGKPVGIRILVDSETGITYRIQDAAFVPALQSHAKRTNGGFIIPPRGRGIK